MEQLEHEEARIELHQGRDRGMVEGLVGGIEDLGERLLADRIADEGRDHPARGVGIGQARQRGEVLVRPFGPVLGHVEASVRREPGQEHVGEVERRGLPAGAHIFHDHVVHVVKARESVVPSDGPGNLRCERGHPPSWRGTPGRADGPPRRSARSSAT